MNDTVEQVELLERVRALVAAETGTRPERITPSTTLFGDLGIDGDDAHELFEAYATEFGVDLTDLELRRHFGPEAWPPWALLILPIWVLWMMRPGDPHKKGGVLPITLNDLVVSAAA